MYGWPKPLILVPIVIIVWLLLHYSTPCRSWDEGEAHGWPGPVTVTACGPDLADMPQTVGPRRTQ